ncbi:MAG: hypothetical protein QXO75_01775 [Nitrososphaerota archaeon]
MVKLYRNKYINVLIENGRIITIPIDFAEYFRVSMNRNIVIRMKIRIDIYMPVRNEPKSELKNRYQVTTPNNPAKTRSPFLGQTSAKLSIEKLDPNTRTMKDTAENNSIMIVVQSGRLTKKLLI